MRNSSQNTSSEHSDRNVQRLLWRLLLPFYSRRFFFVALILHLILLLGFANTIFFQRWLDLQEQEEHGNFICAKPSEKPPGGNSPPPASIQLKEVPQPISAITVKTLNVNTLKEINVSVPTMVQDNISVSDKVAENFLESGTGNGIGKGAGTGVGDGIGIAVGNSGGSIFGKKIAGRNLFVVVDVSASMAQYLDPVFEEVRRDFPNATFKYSYGCAFLPEEYKSYVSSNKEAADKAVAARNKWLEGMIHKFIIPSGIPKAKDVKPEDIYLRMSDCVLDILKNESKVDAIYVFADYHDTIDKKSKLMESILSAARQKHSQIFFHSVDLENDLLAKLASDTKGSFFVKKIEVKAAKK
jgi:hypothetical protein